MKGFSLDPAISYAVYESKLLGTDLWRNREQFDFLFIWKGKQAKIRIAKGYLVNGASVPRTFWSIVPRWGIHGPATIVHDFLCEYLCILVEGQLVKITREEADQIFVTAMKASEVPAQLIEVVAGAVEAYRKVFNVHETNWLKDKAKLEAEWAAANP